MSVIFESVNHTNCLACLLPTHLIYSLPMLLSLAKTISNLRHNCVESRGNYVVLHMLASSSLHLVNPFKSMVTLYFSSNKRRLKRALNKLYFKLTSQNQLRNQFNLNIVTIFNKTQIQFMQFDLTMQLFKKLTKTNSGKIQQSKTCCKISEFTILLFEAFSTVFFVNINKVFPVEQRQLLYHIFFLSSLSLFCSTMILI